MAASTTHVTLVSRFLETVVSGGDITKIDKFLSPTFRLHSALFVGSLDRDGYKRLLLGLRAALPDWRETLTEVIYDGDEHIITRSRGTGTHRGSLFGMPTTGRTITITSIAIDRIVGGKIVERQVMTDGVNVLQQLGVVPTAN